MTLFSFRIGHYSLSHTSFVSQSVSQLVFLFFCLVIVCFSSSVYFVFWVVNKHEIKIGVCQR